MPPIIFITELTEGVKDLAGTTQWISRVGKTNLVLCSLNAMCSTAVFSQQNICVKSPAALDRLNMVSRLLHNDLITACHMTTVILNTYQTNITAPE